MSEHLVKSRMGRLILHAICLALQPRHAYWHLCGMQLELQQLIGVGWAPARRH
jgi:hypothetical protein